MYHLIEFRRRSRRLTACALLVSFVVRLTDFATARIIVFDDFEDGNYDDGPVSWVPSPDRPGRLDASTGDLILTPTPDSDFAIGVNAVESGRANTSVQVQGRSSGVGGFLLVSARNQAIDNNLQYFGVISYQPSLGGTIVALGRGNGWENAPTYFGGFPVMPFDIRHEDAMLQLDVIGNDLSLWAWRPSEARALFQLLFC
jgi:hypothetical protein